MQGAVYPSLMLLKLQEVLQKHTINNTNANGKNFPIPMTMPIPYSNVEMEMLKKL